MASRTEEIRRLKAQIQALKLARLNRDVARGNAVRESNEFSALKREKRKFTKVGRFSSFVSREIGKGYSFAVAARRASKEYAKSKKSLRKRR